MNLTHKESVTKKESKAEKRPLNYILIIVGVFVLTISFTMLSVIFVYKNDLADIFELNIGKVQASQIIYTTYTYSVSENLNSDLSQKIIEGLSEVEFHGVKRFENVEGSDSANFIVDTANSSDKCNNSLARYEMLPVGHFYWVKDMLTPSELASYDFITLEANSELAKDLLTQILDPEVNIEYVETIDELISSLEEGESKIGLVKVNELTPQLKLLRYDNGYYLDNEGDGSVVSCLNVDSYVTDGEYIESVLQKQLSSIIGVSDDQEIGYKNEEILSLRMTGVTAMSRNLASKIEYSGNDAYPAEKIGEFLSEADLTHTSNEVSFVEGCVPEQSMRFCSSPDYIETLKASGIDIVELTGNHNNDYGAQNNSTSIELYDSLGWMHFGGGYNDEDASKILYIEDKGTKIALLGYNYYDSVLTTGAIAGESRAGANFYSAEKLATDVTEAKANADIVIVDFQFQECYSYPEDGGIYPICYRPLSFPDQRAVFRNAIDQGADLVVGTQAHQPQTYEIYNDGIIFYGLGNLYFDQIPWIGTRQGLVLTHYFYDGRLIQSRIDTTLYGNDMQPYVSYGDERELLLDLLYQAR